MRPEQIEAAVRAIARTIFARVDPAAQYLIVRRGRADQFISTRLMKGMPINMVGHRDRGLVPVHDFGLYRITDDDETGHDEIARGWVEVLCEAGVADQRDGDQLTVQDIWASAYQQAYMRVVADSQEDG